MGINDPLEGMAAAILPNAQSYVVSSLHSLEARRTCAQDIAYDLRNP